MKKICFITTVSITLQTFVLNTAQYIHENTDWDISFICSDDEAFSKSLPDYIHFYPVHMERGISVSGIRSMLQMVKIFRREKFDLVQYSTANAALYASLASWIADVPVRLYCQWGMIFVAFQGLKRKIFKAVEKLICSLSTRIEPDSESNLQFALEEKIYKREKADVIWNGSACGVNLDKFDISHKDCNRHEIREKHNISENTYVYVFVGRITRDKGIHELFQAYREICRNDKNICLLMVGPDEVDDTVDRSIYEWARNEQSIRFVGYSSEVEKYLAAADCYVLPSYREGFGMSVVEAEAMGIPVIVTDIPGPKNAMIPGKTGLAVSKANAEELEGAMRYLLANRGEGKEMGAEGHTFAVEKFEQNKLFEYILEDRKHLLNIIGD